MPINSTRSSVTLAEICHTCERLYAEHGFVKWSDVARVYNLSRQAVHNRLKAAVAKGDLDEETFLRWSSPTSRAAVSRSNRKDSREREKLTIRATLSLENLTWLREECEIRKVGTADIINGLINKARSSH